VASLGHRPAQPALQSPRPAQPALQSLVDEPVITTAAADILSAVGEMKNHLPCRRSS